MVVALRRDKPLTRRPLGGISQARTEPVGAGMTKKDPRLVPSTEDSETMMKAAVLAGPGDMRVEQVALPEPGPGQVRVRLEGCGICASNLGPWSGPEWMQFPLEPGALGHEGWGVIDAVGDGVAALKVGDRVATASHKSFAAYDLAEASAAIPLPPALAGKPFPGEPLGCAMNIFRRSDIQTGQTVAIVGIGFLGALLTRLATDAGARVIAISRRAYSLDVARQFGAAETIPMEDHHFIIERVKELTGGKFCERVIEAVGKQWPLDLAGELTAERGKLIVAGYHQDGPRTVNMWLWNWRGIDVINAHERDPEMYAQGIRDAVEAVASGRLDPSPLYTHSYPLERLGEALDATRDRPDGFLKAIVTP
jgi:threonine dehydrogenase-like Zn-dependent dehydrogenase